MTDRAFSDITNTLEDFEKTNSQVVVSELEEHIQWNLRRLLEFEVDDIRWKLGARKVFSWTALIVLLAQNFLVFYLVFQAYQDGRLQDLQAILSILVAATLAETVGAIKIMVEWVFKDIEYKIPDKKHLA
jgi:hypothetical protein